MNHKMPQDCLVGGCIVPGGCGFQISRALAFRGRILADIGRLPAERKQIYAYGLYVQLMLIVVILWYYYSELSIVSYIFSSRKYV